MHSRAAILANVLAAENINVVHSVAATTASFNLQTRTVTLPVLEEYNGAIYDGFVSHEIAHAIFTPPGRYEEAGRTLDPTYVNIICDARIERLMKARYAGMRNILGDMYKALWTGDIVSKLHDRIAELGGIQNLALIERINLYFKFGHLVHVPFADDEMEYVYRTEDAETFDDVVDIVKDLLAKQSDAQGASDASGDSESGGAKVDDSAEDDMQPIEGSWSKSCTPSTGSITQDAIDEAIGSAIIRHAAAGSREAIRVTVPHSSKIPFYFLRHSYQKQDLSSLSEYRPFVDAMVGRFLRAKNARIMAKTRQYDTGTIDPNKLYNYRCSDEIFLTNEVVDREKNHGIVILVDGSGSMDQPWKQVMTQCLLFVMFAKRVGIPFCIYMFNDGNELKSDATGMNTLVVDAKHTLLCHSDMSMRTIHTVMMAFHNKAGCPFPRGGTPLWESLYSIIPALESFKAANKVDKMSFFLISDGEGNAPSISLQTRASSRLTLNEFDHFYDQLTGKSYKVEGNCSGQSMLRIIRDRVQTHSIVGVYLKNGTSLFDPYYFKDAPEPAIAPGARVIALGKNHTNGVYDAFYFVDSGIFSFIGRSKLERVADTVSVLKQAESSDAVPSAIDAALASRKDGIFLFNRLVDQII